jgi:hypothetical protein
MADWSKQEVALIVADYFQMLSAELAGRPYTKTGFRERLAPLLNNRTKGSIEFKHQNISAILIELGQPYVKGYAPRYNYQQLLKDVVIDWLYDNLWIENEFEQFAEKDVLREDVSDFDDLLTDAPKLGDLKLASPANTKSPIKINYLEREQRNSKLGEAGELLVLNYEKWSLVHQGKEALADQVRWIAKEEGDGAGFDILSKNKNGTDKYIEVKTTKLGKDTPFFFTENELVVSQKHPEKYHLFRLFDFENKARMFTVAGSLNEVCHSNPVLYRGYF